MECWLGLQLSGGSTILKLWDVWKWKWSCSVMSDSATPWTVTSQAPPSMGFSRQEYWSGWPFPPPGDLPNPGIEPRFPALEADTLPSEPPGKYKYLRCLLLLLLLIPTKQAWGDLPMGRSTRSFHQNVLVIFDLDFYSIMRISLSKASGFQEGLYLIAKMAAIDILLYNIRSYTPYFFSGAKQDRLCRVYPDSKSKK